VHTSRLMKRCRPAPACGRQAQRRASVDRYRGVMEQLRSFSEPLRFASG
jgi:hypothetical protein